MLEEVNIPGSVEMLGHAAFAKCPSLRYFTVGEGAPGCRLTGNVVLSADGKTLLAVPEGAGTYVKVPEGVETIAYGAFSGAESIKMVEMPETVTRIENFAFCDCIGLVSLDLPRSLEYIGASAFGSSAWPLMGDIDRAEISSVNLGPRVRKVGFQAFEGLNLTSIEVDEANERFASVDGCLTNKAKDKILEEPAGCQ